MKAMILEKAMPVEEEPLKLIDLPVPEPGPGEVRIAVRACALGAWQLEDRIGNVLLVPRH